MGNGSSLRDPDSLGAPNWRPAIPRAARRPLKAGRRAKLLKNFRAQLRRALDDLIVNEDIPTVSLGVTSLVADTYGCDDGRIALTRCALIAGGLGDRCSQRQACKTPPAGARSAHIALVAGSVLGCPKTPHHKHFWCS